jgi:Glycosyltransferase family 87
MFSVPRQAKLIGTGLLFATVLYLTTVRTVNVYHVPVAKETIRFGLCDFHNAVYFPGLAFSRGENPYSATYAAKYPVNREMSPYSPLLLPFASLMGVLPLRMAEYLWYSTNIILMFALSVTLLHVTKMRIYAHRVLLVAALILFSRVGQSNQVLGQLGTYFCLFTFVAVWCAPTNKYLSATGLALASIKPTFGIPLILMMLAARKVQPVVLGLLLGGVGAGLSLGWIIANEPTELLASFENSQHAIVADKDVDPDSAWMRTDLVSVVARNFSIVSDLKFELVGMLFILIPAFAALWKLSSKQQTAESRSLELATVTTMIPLCIYHLSYDLLVVLPALALAISGRIFTTQKQPLMYRYAYSALLVFPLINYFAAYSVMEKLHIDGMLREMLIASNPLSLLAANVVLWIAVYNHKALTTKQKQTVKVYNVHEPELAPDVRVSQVT